MNDEKIAKLPKWARDYIHVLEMRAREAESQVSNSLKPKDERRQYWPAYGDYDANEGRELPSRRVTWPEFGVSATATRHGVEIHGAQPLVVRPNVANVIVVTAERP